MCQGELKCFSEPDCAYVNFDISFYLLTESNYNQAEVSASKENRKSLGCEELLGTGERKPLTTSERMIVSQK